MTPRDLFAHLEQLRMVSASISAKIDLLERELSGWLEDEDAFAAFREQVRAEIGQGPRTRRKTDGPIPRRRSRDLTAEADSAIVNPHCPGVSAAHPTAGMGIRPR